MRKQWTSEDDRIMDAMRERKATWRQIGKRLTRRPKTCAHRFYTRRGTVEDYIKTENPQIEKVGRTCLRCHKDFTADGRFNRLCGNCRAFARKVAA